MKSEIVLPANSGRILSTVASWNKTISLSLVSCKSHSAIPAPTSTALDIEVKVFSGYKPEKPLCAIIIGLECLRTCLD